MPFAETFGTLIVLVPPLIALIAFLFVVTAYEVGPTGLRVQRLLWSTRVPLAGIARAWHDPEAMKRSLRIFGNGGLYSITGLYQNRLLGRYRAFVTDSRRSVVLGYPGVSWLSRRPIHAPSCSSSPRRFPAPGLTGFPTASRNANLRTCRNPCGSIHGG